MLLNLIPEIWRDPELNNLCNGNGPVIPLGQKIIKKLLLSVYPQVNGTRPKPDITFPEVIHSTSYTSKVDANQRGIYSMAMKFMANNHA